MLAYRPIMQGHDNATKSKASFSLAASGTSPATVALTAKAVTPARRILEMRFIACSVLMIVCASLWGRSQLRSDASYGCAVTVTGS